MKKFLSLLLVVCMLLPAFSGCGGNRKLTIIEDGSCTVIYDAATVSSQSLRTLTNALEEATGIEIKPATTGDFTKGTILVGNVALPDGTNIGAELRNKDYKVGIEGDYYLIGGITQEMTQQAVKYFVDNVLPLLKSDKLKVRAKDDAISVGEYRLENVTLGKKSLGHYSIVIPKNASVSELRTAVHLQDHLTSCTGYILNITTADKATTETQIRIGQSICQSAKVENPHDYAVRVAGTVMEIAAESFLGYAAVQEAFIKSIFKASDEALSLDDSSSWSGNGKELALQPLESTGEIRVLFNNIHGHPADGDNPMPVEQPTQMLTELYLEYLPDVIGLQECTKHSYGAGIEDMLASEYARTSDKTDTAIFYRKSTVECLDNGYFAFNNITDEEYNGARRQDASKGVTWAIFKVKATGNVFAVGSTHLWYKHETAIDEDCRAAQMKKIVEVLTNATRQFATQNGLPTDSIPILVGGDYNTRYNGNKFPSMLKGEAPSPFVNANDLAQIKATRCSSHGYATYNEEKGIYDNPKYTQQTYTSGLDHILAGNTGSMTINRVSVLEELYAYLSSDHNPIFTDITFTATAPKI